MIQKLYTMHRAAQEFCESPSLIKRKKDVVLRFDYEKADGTYAYKGIQFMSCASCRCQKEEEMKRELYKAYNSVALYENKFVVYLEGYGLYTFDAEDFTVLDSFEIEADDVIMKRQKDGTYVMSQNDPSGVQGAGSSV